MTKLGAAGIIQDYRTNVKNYNGTPFKKEISTSNKKKNRYRDVPCNDETRVILNDSKEDERGDYIHANWVYGLNSNFILTQGPMDNTAIDFWRMILLYNVGYIAMLCETVEEGRTKCYQYYPENDGEILKFEDITVTNVTKEGCDDEHVTKSIFHVKCGDSEVFVKHLFTKSWPDKGVPTSTRAVMRILYMVRLCQQPVIVHCSAGIGRSGTLIAVEACLQTIMNEKELSLSSVVRSLRNYRWGSVQVDIQYLALADIILEYGKIHGFWFDQELDDKIEHFRINVENYVELRRSVEKCDMVNPRKKSPSKSPSPGSAEQVKNEPSVPEDSTNAKEQMSMPIKPTQPSDEDDSSDRPPVKKKNDPSKEKIQGSKENTQEGKMESTNNSKKKSVQARPVLPTLGAVFSPSREDAAPRVKTPNNRPPKITKTRQILPHNAALSKKKKAHCQEGSRDELTTDSSKFPVKKNVAPKKNVGLRKK